MIMGFFGNLRPILLYRNLSWLVTATNCQESGLHFANNHASKPTSVCSEASVGKAGQMRWKSHVSSEADPSAVSRPTSSERYMQLANKYHPIP